MSNQIGDKSYCSFHGCGREIWWDGLHWNHTEEIKPYHLALPVDGAIIGNEDEDESPPVGVVLPYHPAPDEEEDTNESLREALAAYAHEAWAGWMLYMFSKSPRNDFGQVVIPVDLVTRWARQMNTPYAILPESEKKSDRDEADKMLAIMYGTTPRQEGTVNAPE